MKTEKLTGMVLEYVNEHNDRCTKSIFDKIIDCGYENDFLQKSSSKDYIQQIILDLHPNSPKMITTICYVLGAYARYLELEDVYQTIQSIDRQTLWIQAKPNADKKFISNKAFKEVAHDIGMCEELNANYYRSLFRCIYEGIYCDDMSIIANLRASDISGNTVTLRTDNNESYQLDLPNDLIEDLKDLAESDEWERKNRYGTFSIKVAGKHPDSCFKIENRNKGDSETTYRFGYYQRLRKISKEYLEYNLLPSQIYVSGIMYRVSLKLKENNITIEDAFANDNRNRLVSQIIADELERCNYKIEVKAFRELIKGHLEVFS